VAHDRVYSANFQLIVAVCVLGVYGFVHTSWAKPSSTTEWVADAVIAASRELIDDLPTSVHSVVVVAEADTAPGLLHGVERNLIERGVTIHVAGPAQRDVIRLVIDVRRLGVTISDTRRRYIIAGERQALRQVDVELSGTLVDPRGNSVWSGKGLHSTNEWVSTTMLQRDTTVSAYDVEVPNDNLVSGFESALVMCSVITVLYLFFTQ
jgi:hypothetical protein